MKTIVFLSLFLVACGVEVQNEVDAGVLEETVQPTTQPAKNPLKVTWGMSTQQVLDVAGSPDWTETLPAGTDPLYGDTIWHYTVPSCGDWYVTFDDGVVTARFGLAGGCNPE